MFTNIAVGQKVSRRLRFAELKVMTDEGCKATYLKMTPRHLCAATTEHRKCPFEGDSGGGLIVKENSIEIPTIIGVQALAPRSRFQKGCVCVYTRITKYLYWIERVSGIITTNQVI